MAEHTILVDQEDGPEEFGWVAVTDASTPMRAVAKMTVHCPLTDPIMEYVCDGPVEHYRPSEGENWIECEADHSDAVAFWRVLVSEIPDPLPATQEEERP